VKYVVLILSAFIPAAATAQIKELPQYAYDVVAKVSMATTADAVCEGISSRPKRVQAYIVSLYTQLGQDGISATDAAAVFETPDALNRIAEREVALREKHGAAPEGADGLCAAIRAEATENKDFARLMRIRR